MTPAGEPRSFSWQVRVYYEDTDAAGIVYHASYLRFMERARTEWLRALGFDQSRLRADPGIVFTVRRCDLTYRLPAVFDDLLAVTVALEALRGARILLRQQVLRGGEELVHAGVEVACLDAAGLRPRRLPSAILERFEHAT